VDAAVSRRRVRVIAALGFVALRFVVSGHCWTWLSFYVASQQSIPFGIADMHS